MGCKMGSYVSLNIGVIEVDWGKNDHFINHSPLFHKEDKKVIDHHVYEEKSYEEIGFSRPLSAIKIRLELLGYSLSKIQNEFNLLFDEYEKNNMLLEELGEKYIRFELNFDDFLEIFSRVNLNEVHRKDEHPFYNFSEYVTNVLLSEAEFEVYRKYIHEDKNDLARFFEDFSPYSQLRIFAENIENQEVLVKWNTHDIVNGGWVEEEEIFQELEDKKKFLIVTEGSSDSYIIKKAIDLLRPEVSDFFSYIDMKEHYPFTGTGNLYNFFRGLSKIKVQNKCLFIFDNDAEGVEKYNLSIAINSPKNMKVTKLPDLEEFTNFLTVGPNGRQYSNTNGQAVAIECFLDITYKVKKEPIIRWSSYKSAMNCYQGALEEKEFYTRQFDKVKSVDDKYDFSKLRILVDHIIHSCI